MTEFLRAAIASPRLRHYDPVTGTYLDLAYMEKNILVCSMPTNEFPRVMFRNSLNDLLKLLNLRHGNHWHIWEFRSEGAGYDDADVFNRVTHFPFPDHIPPPFAMIPVVIASMHKFLSQNPENVAILHCKAGKGRSGMMYCAYLIAYFRWTAQSALASFTARRMRPGFGEGISILSQRRYLRYFENWAKDPNREYREIPVVVTEVRILNPVPGLEVRCCGFKEHGRKVVPIYVFTHDDHVGEHEIIGTVAEESDKWQNASEESLDNETEGGNGKGNYDPQLHRTGTHKSIQYQRYHDPSRHPTKNMTGTEVTLRPKGDIHVTADVNIIIDKKFYGPASLSFLRSTAYVWFNVFFEGSHDTGGTFRVAWEDMDGFKGTQKRGSKFFDRMEVDWVICNPMELPAGNQPDAEIDLRSGTDSSSSVNS
ncbi:protein-tyrosine phosphatase-like protein [Lipomyces arxii]|uniref:protein-tyrosine phosphatase-like protein n=1 Tax=Lipomyces arxii TaxID=56418 RepID=UPI0034CF1D43